MPIYEYRCSTCQFQDDLMIKVSAATTLQCPSCQNNTFEKLVSAPSFKLSGSGWYETDFKNKKDIKSSSDSTKKTSDSSEINTKPETTQNIESSKSV
jgi:putative FmdB family regulatory protein